MNIRSNTYSGLHKAYGSEFKNNNLERTQVYIRYRTFTWHRERFANHHNGVVRTFPIERTVESCIDTVVIPAKSFGVKLRPCDTRGLSTKEALRNKVLVDGKKRCDTSQDISFSNQSLH